MAAGIFSAVGMLTRSSSPTRSAPYVLAWEPARPFHTWIYESPVGPWLGLNNTVVLGQLIIGLYFMYATYWFSHRIAARIQAPLSQWLMRYRLIRWIRGAELGAHWGTNA